MRHNPEDYIGFALIVSIASLSVGGIIAALNHIPPNDNIMTAITSMISTMVGALIGRSTK
jgi:putative Mn2+ efflux pump MntP